MSSSGPQGLAGQPGSRWLAVSWSEGGDGGGLEGRESCCCFFVVVLVNDVGKWLLACGK